MSKEETPLNSHFSIIIPTYREVNNIPALVQRIADVDFGNRSFEVILMDDNSDDGSLTLVKHLQIQFPWLTMKTRKGKRDLSQSIIDGFQYAKYPILITMDADLSHPPDKIPDLLAELDQPGVDLVIGSRYVPGGSVDDKWPARRVFSSKMSAWLARLFLGVKAKDPLSGFIAIRKQTVINGAPLAPIGWKVGLEIIIKCQCKTIREIPIHFSERSIGTSNLNSKIALAYFRHVLNLFWYKIFSYR